MDHTLPVAAPRLDKEPARELEIDVSMNARDFTVLELKNFCLTLLTLGIYSAWAKVQRRKYITQHTTLDGHRFDFVAKPLVILRSRLLVVAVLVASNLSEQLNPSMKLTGTILTILAMPWAITASMAFNASQTRYRGHPFVFFGKAKEAYLAFLKAYGLSVITLGLGQFIICQLFSRFLGNNTKLAGRRFSFHQPTRPYLSLAALMMGAVLGGMVVLGAMSVVLSKSFGPHTGENLLNSGPWIEVFVITVGVALYAFMLGVIRGTLANLFVEGLRYGPHTALSEISPRTLGAMYVTNAVAIVASLGLAIPWAYLRCYKYRMSCITVLAQGNLIDENTAKASIGDGETDAIGDAFLDVGFDFGL